MGEVRIPPAGRAVLSDPAQWRLVLPGLAPDTGRVTGSHPRAHATHAHPHREVLLALWGDTVYGRDGEVLRCPPGTCMVFPPMQLHDEGYRTTSPLGHVWIALIADRAFARLLSSNGRRTEHGPLMALPARAARDAMAAFEDAEELASTAPAVARIRALGGIAALAAALLNPPASPPDPRAAAIPAICAHIVDTAGAGVSIRHLARIAGYSPFHFTRVFRQTVGCTVHAYVDRCRADAVRAMRMRGLRHAEMAHVLGFSCPSAFSRWLRSRRLLLTEPSAQGQTPSQGGSDNAHDQR